MALVEAMRLEQPISQHPGRRFLPTQIAAVGERKSFLASAFSSEWATSFPSGRTSQGDGEVPRYSAGV